MSKKQIVFAVTNDLTYDRRMYRICSALAAAGMDVLLIGRKRRNSKLFKPVDFGSKLFSCWFNKGPLFYAEYNIRLFFILLGTPMDIVCACDLDTAPAIRLAGWLKQKKSVYDAHEYFSEVPELSQRPVVKKVWEWIGSITIPTFDACYTVGEELARLMGRKYKVHFEVIRNIAPSLNNISTASIREHHQKILLYQGALNIGRGLETCIDAMALLPEWHFWLAGEGDITLELKDRTTALGLNDRVHFLGWVSPDEIPGLMQKARLGINLREKGSLNDYYSLPNKFFDAIHAGLPSINMNYPEYAAVCANFPCALLLDQVDAEKIAQMVNYLDQYPDEYDAMAEACLAAAKEYTWENESKKLITLYEKLIG